jgi:hypothetical protein
MIIIEIVVVRVLMIISSWLLDEDIISIHYSNMDILMDNDIIIDDSSNDNSNR